MDERFELQALPYGCFSPEDAGKPCQFSMRQSWPAYANFDPGSLLLQPTVVPEPSTWLLLVTGLGIFTLTRRTTHA